MVWWQLVLLALVATMLLMAAGGFFLWKTASVSTKELARRVRRLPARDQIRLVAGLAVDSRVPFGVRLIPPLLILYLALPIDLVPDLIPVLGQLDDILIALLALALVLRFTPVEIIESRLTQLEEQARAPEAPTHPPPS